MDNIYRSGWWLNPTPLKSMASSIGMMILPNWTKWSICSIKMHGYSWGKSQTERDAHIRFYVCFSHQGSGGVMFEAIFSKSKSQVFGLNLLLHTIVRHDGFISCFMQPPFPSQKSFQGVSSHSIPIWIKHDKIRIFHSSEFPSHSHLG